MIPPNENERPDEPLLAWSDAEIESLLEPEAVIAAIREAFTRGYDSVRMPQRLQLDVGPAIILMMPCAIAGEQLCGMKIVSVSRDPGSEGRAISARVPVCFGFFLDMRGHLAARLPGAR